MSCVGGTYVACLATCINIAGEVADIITVWHLANEVLLALSHLSNVFCYDVTAFGVLVAAAQLIHAVYAGKC